VIAGTAEVLAPTEKGKRARIEMPAVTFLDRGARYKHLLGRAKDMPPALMAVALVLVRAGRAEALIKGSPHTDELMAEVVANGTGLRTGRRVSHVFFADVPTYPHTLLITDAAINIDLILDDKVDFVQNAIDLAHILGVLEPKVAILAAVETVTAKMLATLDASAPCKMADRDQIIGGILDGPLAFDNAVSMVAANTKGIRPALAWRADILVVQDLESGNMLAKQLEYLADTLLAGVVVGASVPIVLTRRADSAEARAASCAIALLMANAKRKPRELNGRR